MLTLANVFLFVVLCFIAGILLASFFAVPQLIIYELFLLGVFYSIIFFKQKVLIVFAVCLIVLGFGMWRGSSVGPMPFPQNEQSRPLDFLKTRFDKVIQQNLSPPQSAILSAILLGNKQDISKEWKEKLNIAGLRHITAISGMHIVILSIMLIMIGIMIGLHRGQAFYFAVGFLWLFILMIGFQPSAIRAGIMGSIFLLAQKLGRQKTTDRALFLTAAVMLGISPSLLRYSIGFQLSFLASLGIIYLTPTFQYWLHRITRNRVLRFLRTSQITGLLAMTFGAQVFVLPILVYYFGQFSIASPLTNLLVVPFLPWLMGLGFLFVILGAIFLPLAFILLPFIWLLLSYIAKITALFASFSFSAVYFSIHWLFIPFIYALLAILIWQLRKYQNQFMGA